MCFVDIPKFTHQCLCGALLIDAYVVPCFFIDWCLFFNDWCSASSFPGTLLLHWLVRLLYLLVPHFFISWCTFFIDWFMFLNDWCPASLLAGTPSSLTGALLPHWSIGHLAIPISRNSTLAVVPAVVPCCGALFLHWSIGHLRHPNLDNKQYYLRLVDTSLLLPHFLGALFPQWSINPRTPSLTHLPPTPSIYPFARCYLDLFHSPIPSLARVPLT